DGIRDRNVTGVQTCALPIYEFNWQKNHWKSLESAYRASPYFEFFEDELHFLYEKRFRFLMDFNRQCTTAMLTCLEVEKNHAETRSEERRVGKECRSKTAQIQ